MQFHKDDCVLFFLIETLKARFYSDIIKEKVVDIGGENWKKPTNGKFMECMLHVTSIYYTTDKRQVSFLCLLFHHY